jgi:deazaflavin-dependent oxidoreductase (nitroreductase family)
METDHRAQADPAFWQRAAGGFLRLINPMVRRMVAAGVPTGAENILLTTRGRRSGQPRTVPVGMLKLEGRRFVQGSYGEGGWVGNLRAAGEATITTGSHREPVEAVELGPDEAAAILRRALESYPRSRVLRGFLGRFRPPIGVLIALHRRVDDTLEEYVADARRHPLFELRRPTRAAG